MPENMFSDLIPNRPKPSSGMFDDLIPLSPMSGSVEELQQQLANPNLGQQLLEREAFTGGLKQIDEGEFLRPSFEATGATLGAIAGARTPAGPIGMTIGAGLGRGAGGLAYDAYRDVRRQFVDDPSIPPTWDERLERAGRDAVTESLLTGGTYAGTGVWARLLGIRPGMSEAYRESQDLGVNLGTANVAEQGIAPGAAKTFGRLPLIGGRAKSEAQRQMGELSAAQQRLFGQVGPYRTETDIGEGIEAGARLSYRMFTNEADLLYAQARRLAEAEGPSLGSNGVRAAALKVLQQDDANRAMMTTGKPTEGLLPVQVRAYIEQLTKLNPRMTVQQLRTVDERLEQLMSSTAQQQGYRLHILDDIRDAGTNSLKAAARAGSPAAQAQLRANNYFAEGIKLFETPVAQKVGRVERGMFKPGFGKPGSVNPDEIARLAFATRSPQAVAQLEQLAGRESVREVTRFRLEKAWDSSFVTGPKGRPRFDAERFREALALDRPNSADYQALKAMLRGSGADIADLEQFARVARNVTSVELADASTFVARSAALRGSGGLMSAVRGVGTAGLSGVAHATGDPSGISAGAIVVVGLIRGGLGMLMRPRQLRWATSALDNRLDVAQRRAFALRFLRDALATAGEEWEPGDAIAGGQQQTHPLARQVGNQ